MIIDIGMAGAAIIAFVVLTWFLIDEWRHAFRPKLEWHRSGRDDVGFGLADQCPACGHKGNQLITGWLNPVSGLGKAQWKCLNCGRIWTWARHGRSK